jgi:hypothetical protein
MSKPTASQIHAVQDALYKDGRLDKLSELHQQLSVLMNFSLGSQLPTKDVRYPAGSGPQWFYPDTGGLDQSVIAAAGICDQIAKTILQMRQDVSGVAFPEADKQHLLTALKEEAASWTARGHHWRDPKPPDVDAVVGEIYGHLSAAVDAVGHVRQYLKAKQFIGGR